jgi:membrane-associated phospholipid phosphatase
MRPERDSVLFARKLSKPHWQKEPCPLSEPFCAWPGWRHLGQACLLGLATGAWFEIIYGGADLVAAQHDYRVRLYFEAELAIPFVPAAVLLYMSLYLLFWAAPFILRSRRELTALAAALAGVTLFAGVCFLIFPAECIFPGTEEAGAWTGLVRFAKALALRYNLMPSLHVALSVVCIGVFAAQASRAGKVLLWTWALGICGSTLLLHQHYVLDVITGFALGLGGVRWVYGPWMARVPRANRSRDAALPV